MDDGGLVRRGKREGMMTSLKPSRDDRERARVASGTKPAAKRSPRPARSRPALSPAPARTPRAQPTGNALVHETIPAFAATAATLAQAPLAFGTEPAAIAVLTNPSPSRAHERQSKSAVGVRQKFGELREALAEGWEIVQPIFARPLWSVSDDSITAFNFVLRRERTTRLVTVPSGRTVQRFIRERQLIVDYRN
jgi:hypothetical protein